MSDSIDFNKIHSGRAAELVRIQGAKVLIVGVNTGGDCKYFVDFGASEVHGVDVIENIGSEYAHEKVFYHRVSAEQMSLFKNNTFDLVYCFATLEHIPDIQAALKEMARVTRPGGAVYCVAAPLWNSPVGHHMGCFDDHPWVHLRMGREEIIQYSKKHGISGERGHTIEGIVDYMLNPQFFNKRPAKAYIEASSNLPRMRIECNELALEPEDRFQKDLITELAIKGYSSEELRAIAHTYVGRKQHTMIHQAAVKLASVTGVRPILIRLRDRISGPR